MKTITVLLFASSTLAPLATAQTPVPVHVVDQSGAEIAGSLFSISGLAHLAPTGTSVALDPGTYDVEVYPGVFSTPHTGFGRRVTGVVVTTSTQHVKLEWITKQVSVRVRDQQGAELPGSGVRFAYPNHFVPTGTTVALPITDEAVYPTMNGAGVAGYDLDVQPGVFGTPQSNFVRTVPDNEVSMTTDTLEYEWITKQVLVRVRDQQGAEIAGSGVRFAYPNHFVPTGTTVALPITDETVYPTMAGPGKFGYDLDVQPGVFGVAQSNFVRTVLDNEVSQATNAIEHEWIMNQVAVRVRDQHGAEIAGSGVRFAYPNYFVPTGVSVSLPVTDETVYPALAGPGRFGYDLDVFPGVSGHAHSNLGRTVLDNEVNLTTTVLAYEWAMHDCALQVVDAQGAPVAGSALMLPSPFCPFQIGQWVALPVTENAVYPTIFGLWADGLPIRVTPGDLQPSTSATFQFEVRASGSLTPGAFQIGGNTYSLVCQANRPPAADAGGNVGIVTAQQATTTVVGVATDPDGGSLTFRWLEGSTVLRDWSSVTGTAAPLDLGSLAALAIGVHELTLEVRDGALTATDSMLLTVGNSPPAAVCGGGGTFQAGTDPVTLTGQVADFDGDALTYQWRHGSTVLAAGALYPPTGGASVAVPAKVLTTGANAALGVGSHELTLVVSDGINPAVECVVQVLVVDSQAPRLAPTSSHAILWPPNHELVDVVIFANASDASNGPVLLAATVSSSEDPLKDGSGDTIPDVVGPAIDQNTGRITLRLRAERSGKGEGRIYTVTITATDAASNQSQTQVRVAAPHDRGQG